MLIDSHYPLVDDSVHHRIVHNEGDYFYRRAALRKDERVNLINLADHRSPTPPGDFWAVLLNEDELMQPRIVPK
jgi:hypothetical protein